jgi:phosphoglucomutase
MERLFDFDRMRTLIADGSLSLCFDAMHAVNGPYGKEILYESTGPHGA